MAFSCGRCATRIKGTVLDGVPAASSLPPACARAVFYEECNSQGPGQSQKCARKWLTPVWHLFSPALDYLVSILATGLNCQTYRETQCTDQRLEGMASHDRTDSSLVFGIVRRQKYFTGKSGGSKGPNEVRCSPQDAWISRGKAPLSRFCCGDGLRHPQNAPAGSKTFLRRNVRRLTARASVLCSLGLCGGSAPRS